MSDERERPRQLVVTCGTSQLEALLKIGDLAMSYNDYRNWLKEEEPVTGAEASLQEVLEDGKFGYAAAALVRQLKKKCGSPSDCRTSTLDFLKSSSNPFGAEISTLLRMAQENMWTAENDHVRLLYSPTKAGLWSAGLASWALSQFWELPEERLDAQVVYKLYGITTDPDGALGALADRLVETKAKADEGGRRLVLVMTGGFKSVVPCLTIFSLVWGVPLVYLFEKSDQLQRLHEQLGRTATGVSEFWQQVWNDLKTQGERQSVGVCLERALAARLPTMPGAT